MAKALLLLAVLGILAGESLMAESGKKVFPYDYTVKKLENGLTVIMIPMSGANGIVSYYSVVRTGSRDEFEAGHSGFAHFFEHMMFRGTKKNPGNVYDKYITEMGADANAYTTDDYTAYHLTFAEKYLEKVMDLEADRFQNLFYEVPAFQTEAGAVYGEYRKNVTNPWMVLIEKMQDVAFDKHTYKHTTMGFERDIKAMPTMYEYSRLFFQRYYRPENVVIVVAGSVDVDNTMKLMKKYYGSWKPGYVTPQVQAEPKQKAPRTADISYPGKTLPLLTVAYKGPAFNPADKKAMASVLLGDIAFGRNSDVYKKLALKEQKVDFIGGEFGMNRDPYLYMVYTMVKEAKDVPYVEQEILATVERFRKEPMPEAKLQAAKKNMKYSFLMNLDTPDKVAGSLARFVALTGGIEAVEKMYATLDQVTAQDLLAAANEYLIPEGRTIIRLKGAK